MHCWILFYSAALCQLFKFDMISALPNSIFDIYVIGLAQTSREYHQRFFRTDKNCTFCINSIKMLFNILKSKTSFGDFVIRYRFSMLFNAGLSIVRNRKHCPVITFDVDSIYRNIVQHYYYTCKIYIDNYFYIHVVMYDFR